MGSTSSPVYTVLTTYSGEGEEGEENKDGEDGAGMDKSGEHTAAGASAVIKKHKTKVEDDEYKNAGGEANYYSIAHTIKEEIKSQPSIMENGTLKEYQIKVAIYISLLYKKL